MCYYPTFVSSRWLSVRLEGTIKEFQSFRATFFRHRALGNEMSALTLGNKWTGNKV